MPAALARLLFCLQYKLLVAAQSKFQVDYSSVQLFVLASSIQSNVWHLSKLALPSDTILGMLHFVQLRPNFCTL